MKEHLLTSTTEQSPISPYMPSPSVFVFLLGLFSMFGIFILGPIAWWKGWKLLANERTTGQPLADRGLVQAGATLGIVSTVVFVGVFVLVAGVYAARSLF